MYNKKNPFHQIGPLGRFGLVVAMSVCLCVCVSVPFSCDSFKVLKSKDFRYAMLLFININQ